MTVLKIKLGNKKKMSLFADSYCKRRGDEEHKQVDGIFTSLRSQQWQQIQISGLKLFYKAKFGASSYCIVLTDLVRVYFVEESGEEEILRRFERHNKNSKVSLPSLLEALHKFFSQQENLRSELFNNLLAVHIRKKSATGVPFAWTWEIPSFCAECSPHVLKHTFFEPVFFSNLFVCSYSEKLEHLLVQKDLQMDDMLKRGAKCHVKVKPFSSSFADKTLASEDTAILFSSHKNCSTIATKAYQRWAQLKYNEPSAVEGTSKEVTNTSLSLGDSISSSLESTSKISKEDTPVSKQLIRKSTIVKKEENVVKKECSSPTAKAGPSLKESGKRRQVEGKRKKSPASPEERPQGKKKKLTKCKSKLLFG